MTALGMANIVACVLLVAVLLAIGIGEWLARRKARRNGVYL